MSEQLIELTFKAAKHKPVRAWDHWDEYWKNRSAKEVIYWDSQQAQKTLRSLLEDDE